MNDHELMTALDELLALCQGKSTIVEKMPIVNRLLDLRGEAQARIQLEKDLANLPSL